MQQFDLLQFHDHLTSHGFEHLYMERGFKSALYKHKVKNIIVRVPLTEERDVISEEEADVVCLVAGISLFLET